MKIELVNWERNGYDDSDFYTAIYDTETKCIGAVLVGSTRYAGGFTSAGERVSAGHPAILEAYQALERFIHQKFFDAELLVYNTPDVENLRENMVLETTVPCKMKAKKKDPCKKCNGSGFWQNPNNLNDKRKCFTCDGQGFILTKGEGWVNIPAGTVITVKDWRSFGKFYSNGWNKPCRGNTTVYGTGENGEHLQVSLEKCKVHGPVPKLEDFAEKAHELAKHGQFQHATGVHCAWLTESYVSCPENF